MLVCFEITDNKQIEELQRKILANKRETEEENDIWTADTDKLDAYIFNSIAEFYTRKTNKEKDYWAKSNIWNYQVNTDANEELYEM